MCALRFNIITENHHLPVLVRKFGFIVSLIMIRPSFYIKKIVHSLNNVKC